MFGKKFENDMKNAMFMTPRRGKFLGKWVKRADHLRSEGFTIYGHTLKLGAGRGKVG